MKKIISGKVRDVFDVSEDQLVVVTTDRISSFDVILSKPVRDKGKVLNAVSLYWFDYTKDIIKNHILSDKLSDMPEEFQKPEYEGRTILVKKLKMIPYEFVVRGYIFGSMWKPYQESRSFCGIPLNEDYQLAQKLVSPILTPSTKAAEGHDEYVTYERMEKDLGVALSKKLKDVSFALYEKCYKHAYENGIIIADTKFEFGLDQNGELVLADEIFTPDCSRFWSLEDYKVGESPKSYDKQFVRDWLTDNKVDGEIQFDNVPDEILEKTAEIYQECLRKIVG